MTRLLSISSSPRRNGNSEILLKSFIKGVEEAGCESNMIRVNNLKVRPCQACDGCALTGECVQKDDMQKIYPMVKEARAMVVATPIYFGSLSAQLKMFVDRHQCWWHAKYNIKKPFVPLDEGRKGFFISVGALKNKRFSESALSIVKVYYHNINFVYSDGLCYRGFDHKADIEKEPDALESAYQMGLKLASENADANN